MTFLQDPYHGYDDVYRYDKELEIGLPDVSSFPYGAVDNPETFEKESISSASDELGGPGKVEEDIWTIPHSVEEVQAAAQVQSWDSFYDNGLQEPRTVYLSEEGREIFDAALVTQAEQEDRADFDCNAGQLVQDGPVLASLVQLGLGRESILFRYADDQRSFCPRIPDGRMSGYSLGVFQDVNALFIRYGNQMRRIRSFTEIDPRSGIPLPSLVALAGTCSLSLAALQASISDACRSVASLLQLQEVFHGPGQVLSCLDDILDSVAGIDDEETLLSKVFAKAWESDHKAPWLRQMINQMLSSASKPWLSRMSSWLGLQSENISTASVQIPNFVTVKEATRRLRGGGEIKESEPEYKPSQMPTFVSDEDGLNVFEIGRILRLLQAHQPYHPLIYRTSSHCQATPRLAWQFSWHDIQRVSALAREYETNLKQAIREFQSHGNLHKINDSLLCDQYDDMTAASKIAEQDTEVYISKSIAQIEMPLPDLIVLHDNPIPKRCPTTDFELNGLDLTQDAVFAPPVSLLASLSFQPIIAAQARLVNEACLRLLFREHHLSSHFSILYRYNLLGDGLFTSRLSHALFDPDMKSAERRKGRSRLGTSGLQLGFRETWPPASSELRLALMEILTDSYFPPSHTEGSFLFREELPGGLSFAIRELSEDELQRCMNPDSIEALDFLRIQYTPPSPLNAVISDASLTKYDVIFKLLLRVTRMLFVVKLLSRKTASRTAWRTRPDPMVSRFRIESHHFVSAVCTYFFDSVAANWQILERRIIDYDKALDRQDVSHGESMQNFRSFHEQLLDRLMLALLLRRRQAQVLQLLEEIFSQILLFAKHQRLSDGQTFATGGQIQGDLSEVYPEFKKKVRIFIKVLRGLAQRKERGGTKGSVNDDTWSKDEFMSEDGGNSIGQLLLIFEMSGFYS